MAYPSVPNSFTDGETIDAGRHNENYAAIVNGLSDGTKDINVGSCTMAGNLTVAGNTVLGDSSGDTVSFSGTLATDIMPTADATYSLGSASYSWKKVVVGSVLATGTTAETGAIYANNIINAWGYIGSMATLLAGFNMSTPVRTDTGDYTVHFRTSYSVSTYGVGITAVTATVVAGTVITKNADDVTVELRKCADLSSFDTPFMIAIYGAY